MVIFFFLSYCFKPVMIEYLKILPAFIFTSLPWNQRGFYVKQGNYIVLYLIMNQRIIVACRCYGKDEKC